MAESRFGRAARRVAALLFLVAFGGVAGATAALAQTSDSRVGGPADRLVVVGRDTEVAIEATLPLSCAGSVVTFGLYEHGGAARINSVDPLFKTVVTTVAPDGKAAARLPVPASMPPELRTVWPGVSGACLPTPVVSTERGLLFGLLDRTENPGTSATFVVPRSSLFFGHDVQVQKGSLTVFADGVRCTIANLEDSSAKDAAGNVRIHVGGPSQPTACSREGSRVTFRYPNGALLFESRTLALGVSQPFENLAPEGPAVSGVVDLRATISAQFSNPDGTFIPPDARSWRVSLEWASPIGFLGSFSVYRLAGGPGSAAQLVATLPAPEIDGAPVAYEEPIAFPLRQVCYQVSGEAVVGSLPRAEVCTPSPPTSGPAAPDAGNSATPEDGQSGLLFALGVAVTAVAAALAVAHLCRRGA
jgi:hypothetical protein